MIDIFPHLRDLAKSQKYQTLFANEKEIGLRLFINEYDYSDIQIAFLNYLAFYYTIQMDISFGEVDEKVFEDYIYEEAYMIWKHKKRKEEMKETTDKTSLSKNQERKPEKLVKTQFVFRKPKGLSS